MPARRTVSSADDGAAPDGPQYPVGSVDNLLRLLSLFAAHRDIGVSEAARIIDVAPSTAHRLIAMLSHHGYLEQDAATRRYRAGHTLINLGLAVIAKHDARAVIHPHLEQLSARFRETVSYAVLVDDKLAFVDSVEATRALRVTTTTGALYPAHSTSAGKIILAFADDKEIRRLYPRERLAGGTDRAALTRTRLREELAQARAVGYAVNRGESDEDIGAVAVPVAGRNGLVRGSLTTSMPLSRFAEIDLDAMVAALKSHSSQLAEELD